MRKKKIEELESQIKQNIGAIAFLCFAIVLMFFALIMLWVSKVADLEMKIAFTFLLVAIEVFMFYGIKILQIETCDAIKNFMRQKQEKKKQINKEN